MTKAEEADKVEKETLTIIVGKYTEQIDANKGDRMELSRLHYNRGRFRDRLGLALQAYKDYKKALELDPRNFNAQRAVQA